MKRSKYFNIDKNANELKQHLSLSSFARNIINEDIDSFTTFSSSNRSLSGFLNRVFKNYYKESIASIEFLKDKKEKELLSLYLEFNVNNIVINNKKDLKDKQIDLYIKECKDNVSSLFINKVDYIGKKFRINKENINILKSLEEGLYYSKLGDYLKAIFEDYASKQFSIREQIYFKDYIDTINKAIKNKKRLKVAFYSSKENESKKTTFYSVYPYKLVTDKMGIYNYLVGYQVKYEDISKLSNSSTTSNKDKRMEVCSRRITLIKYISILNSKSNKLTKNQIETLEKGLASNGAMYLIGKELSFKVKFTEVGLLDFKKYIYTRPVIYEVDSLDPYLIHFKCSSLQALSYFLKFGKEAKVIIENKESLEIVKKLKEKAQEIIDIYS